MLLSAGRSMAVGMSALALPLTTEAIFMMADEVGFPRLPFCRLCRGLDEVYLATVNTHRTTSNERNRPSSNSHRRRGS